VGNLTIVLLQISSRLRRWKSFENRPVFDEVMPKILLVRFFSGHGVVSHFFPTVISLFVLVGANLVCLCFRNASISAVTVSERVCILLFLLLVDVCIYSIAAYIAFD